MKRTLTYFAAFVALGMASASLGPTLPGLAEQTQTSLAGISALFVARSLGYLVGSLGVSRLYDQFPGHPIMVGALFGMAATMAMAPAAPLLWLLIPVMLLLGVSESTLDVGGNTLLVWEHGDDVGPAMNGLHFSFGLGAFLSPLIVAEAIARSGGIAWAYWVLALLFLPAAMRLLTLPSPGLPASTRPEHERPVNRLLVALIAFFFFLHVGIEASFGGWLYTYAVESNLLDVTAAAYVTSAFWGALTAGRLLAIPIAARLRPQWILLIDLSGVALSAGLLLGLRGSSAALWAAAIIAGLSIASLFPTSMSFAQRRLPISGRVTGWFFAGASLGGMSLPWLIGQFFERAGPAAMPRLLLAALGMALAVYAALRHYPPRPLAREQRLN